MKHLFSPYTLKGHTIKNRVVMAPMELLVRETRGGFVNEGHLRHYGQRARGGIGLIITEATSVHPGSMNVESQLGAWSDEHIPGLRRLADECHRHGVKALLQLQHLGVRNGRDPAGPSAYRSGSGDIDARGMTMDELHELQDAYVAAVLRAHEAGFDGIQLHGAHGYLLNQFSSPNVNVRDDRYGGSAAARLTFVKEIVQRVRPVVRDDFLLSYRMGCNQPTLQEGIELAVELERLGIDLLDVSSCGYSSWRPELPEAFPYNWVIYGGSKIREHVSIPVIVVYEIRTPQRAEDILARGLADFTAIGRDLIVDAEWANKAQSGGEITYCIRCQPCVIFHGEKCVML